MTRIINPDVDAYLWRRRKMNNRRLLSGVDNGSSVLDLRSVELLVGSASSVSLL